MDHSKLILSILEKYDIECYEEGKNVTDEAINVQCPLCPDHSNHCGIFRDSLQFKCWRCSQTGSFAYLLSVLTGQPKDLCKQEIEEFTASFHLDPEMQIQELLKENESDQEKKPKREFSGKYPEYMEELDPEFPLLQHYMQERDICLETLKKHECGICRVGPYMNRLIIPIFSQGELVSYQGADMTLKAEVKYKTADSEVNQYLYNWDRLDPYLDFILVTEGILDAWRLEKNAVATFGTSLTDRQFELLLIWKPKKLIFCWDSDAYFYAERESQRFAPFVEEVYAVNFPEGEDPDSLGHVRSWELIEEQCFVRS
jgi:hypothetical protein